MRGLGFGVWDSRFSSEGLVFRDLRASISSLGFRV